MYLTWPAPGGRAIAEAAPGLGAGPLGDEGLSESDCWFIRCMPHDTKSKSKVIDDSMR